jgi:DNA-binding transcriptional LysR family regulator
MVATMIESVTLDQLRGLVTVVEQGNFSAAARKLQRVQSAVSTSMANLEEHLGVSIWDRSTKVAKLTPQGQAVLHAARRILSEVDALRDLTVGMAAGLEAAVSLCFDALFPLRALIDLCADFSKEFPTVDLRIDTQVMSAVTDRVRSGSATLGVVSPPGLGAGLERERLASIVMIPVVAKPYPLASHEGTLSEKHLADAVQIVLSERSESGVADQAVLSAHTWRVADLHTKHEMIRAGLGWGNLPEHLVREDLEAGRLVALRLEQERTLALWAIYKKETVLGPAHRWLLGKLRAYCERDAPASLRGARRHASAGKSGRSRVSSK